MDSTGQWTDEELRQLEDPQEWDWENAVEVHRSENAGAVVAVRFTGDEFEKIATRAEALGEKLTHFIHQAALIRARGESEPKRGRHKLKT